MKLSNEVTFEGNSVNGLAVGEGSLIVNNKAQKGTFHNGLFTGRFKSVTD